MLTYLIEGNSAGEVQKRQPSKPYNIQIFDRSTRSASTRNMLRNITLYGVNLIVNDSYLGRLRMEMRQYEVFTLRLVRLMTGRTLGIT